MKKKFLVVKLNNTIPRFEDGCFDVNLKGVGNNHDSEEEALKFIDTLKPDYYSIIPIYVKTKG